MDNYGTHKHPNVQNWLKRHPRFVPHFVPTSSSWLNLVERWFRELTARRYDAVPSAACRFAKLAITQFLDAWNEIPSRSSGRRLSNPFRPSCPVPPNVGTDQARLAPRHEPQENQIPVISRHHTSNDNPDRSGCFPAIRSTPLETRTSRRRSARCLTHQLSVVTSYFGRVPIPIRARSDQSAD